MSHKREPPKVALDTNMLLLIGEGVQVFSQIEEALEARPVYVVITPVIEELHKLASSGPPLLSKRARFALEIARNHCVIIDYPLVEGESVDDCLVRFAIEHNAIVATNDKELRRKLRERGLPEIYLREESMRLEFEGYIS